MSIVAVRDGIMASDTRANGGDLEFSMRKMQRDGDRIVGWAGNWTDGKVFAKWWLSGADLDALPSFVNREGKAPDFVALTLSPDGWEYWFEWFVPESNEDILLPYMAIGSGQQAAMAAMHMGATAAEAVGVACAVAAGCSTPIQVEALGK
ncbi:MAG: hypothetical protein ACPG4X_14690 [Pikeienuella sp.]